jgi:hypothetical protein
MDFNAERLGQARHVLIASPRTPKAIERRHVRAGPGTSINFVVLPVSKPYREGLPVVSTTPLA